MNIEEAQRNPSAQLLHALNLRAPAG